MNTSKWDRYLRFWRPNIAADVDAELTFHVDARIEELIAGGLAPEAARVEAIREFGDIEAARRQLRRIDEHHADQQRRLHLASDVGRDVRVALRGLARSPTLVAVVVVTLALGIGITSGIYSIVDSYFLRPLAGANGSELVVLGRTEREIALPHDLSFPDFRDYRSDTAVFQALGAYSTQVVNLATDRGAERLWLDEATANYFAVLGLRPMLGRTFAPNEDDGVLAHPVVVLTYKGWQSHFGGDSTVVGRVVRLNEHPVTIIGVLPPEFHGVRPVLDLDAIACINQIWPALGTALDDRSSAAVSVFGRLHPGLSLRRAREAARVRAQQLERAYPSTNRNVGVVLMRERYSRPSIAVASVMPALVATFMTLVVLVLLAACANVASLLIARVVGRSRELAIRAAIGASQWRIVRQVMVECALLAMLGGLAGVAVAAAAIRALAAIHLATDLPMRWGMQLDHRVLAFTAMATVFAAIVSGVAPISTAGRRDLNDALRSSAGNAGTRSHQRLRAALVVCQIAVSVLVLVCAGLFTRSAANVTRTDLGFRTDHLLMVSTSLSAQRYDSVSGRALYREILRRAGAVPGVRSVAIAQLAPFGADVEQTNIRPVAAVMPVPENGFSYFTNVVGGDYFETMGITLLAGRVFSDRDDAKAPAVAIVNDALGKAVWPGQPAVGKRFHIGKDDGPVVEIVGVVRGIQTLIVGETPRPYIFLPIGQSFRSDVILLAHTAVPPTSIARPLREAVTGLDADLPTYDVRSMEEHLRDGQAFLFARLGSAFAGVFGLLALVLATVGVYGVVAYFVAQHTREIGVRVALGARLPSILRLVLGKGLRLTWIGVAIGAVVSIATTGILSSILVGVPARDPLTVGLVAGVLTMVTALACLIPARRATRIDPVIALRSD